MHIKHITFRVKAIDPSIDFYETMTGLQLVRRFTAGNAELAFLSNGAGETEIELVHIPGGQTYEGKGMFICFETDQLDAMHEQALAKNLKPSPVQVPGDGSRYFYVYDPDGVSVQLREFPTGQE